MSSLIQTPETPVPPVSGGLFRFHAELSYDGTNFRGWAKQPGLRTVQGEIERVLAVLGQETIAVTVAGRTDTGVHARRQHIHFDVSAPNVSRWEHAAGEEGLTHWITRRLRRLLQRDPDIVLRSVMRAEPGFDARFSALWREYSYRIWDRPEPMDPLVRGFTLPVRGLRTPELLNRACQDLLGLHDWRAYCRPSATGTTVRELQVFRWYRDADGALVSVIRADAFCHHMVRCLVGACLSLTPSELTAGALREILETRQQSTRYTMVPSRGLVLEHVGYPAPAALAARAQLTRAKRPPLFPREDTPSGGV